MGEIVVQMRRLSLGNRVVQVAWVDPETIKNHQQYGTAWRFFAHAHSIGRMPGKFSSGNEKKGGKEKTTG
jgi:hypothetical protein